MLGLQYLLQRVAIRLKTCYWHQLLANDRSVVLGEILLQDA